MGEKRHAQRERSSLAFYCWLTSSGSVVLDRVVMETFGEAEQVRLMLSVMCVWTAVYLFLFFFFLREALGPAPPAPNVFHLLNSWPQSDAKTDRNARGNWERGSEKKANVIQRGSNMDLNKRGRRRRRRAKSGWSEKDSSADNEGGAASYPKIKSRSVRCLDTELLNDYTGNSEGTPNNTSSDSNSTPSWQTENNHHEITKKRRLTTHVNITTERKIAPKRLSDQSFRRTPARLIFHRLLWWQAWTCVGVMSITSERGEGGGEGEGLLWVGGEKNAFSPLAVTVSSGDYTRILHPLLWGCLSGMLTRRGAALLNDSDTMDGWAASVRRRSIRNWRRDDDGVKGLRAGRHFWKDWLFRGRARSAFNNLCRWSRSTLTHS